MKLKKLKLKKKKKKKMIEDRLPIITEEKVDVTICYRKFKMYL